MTISGSFWDLFLVLNPQFHFDLEGISVSCTQVGGSTKLGCTAGAIALMTIILAVLALGDNPKLFQPGENFLHHFCAWGFTSLLFPIVIL